MPDQKTIDRYLDDVDSYLQVDRTQRERILAEIQGHLHDAAEGHINQGVQPLEAMRRAMAELGPPQDVATEFASPTPPSRSVRGWRRWTPMVLPAALLIVSVTLTLWIAFEILIRGGPASMGERTVLRTLLPFTLVFAVLTIATHLAIRKADQDPTWRRVAWLFAVLAGAIYGGSFTL